MQNKKIKKCEILQKCATAKVEKRDCNSRCSDMVHHFSPNIGCWQVEQRETEPKWCIFHKYWCFDIEKYGPLDPRLLWPVWVQTGRKMSTLSHSWCGGWISLMINGAGRQLLLFSHWKSVIAGKQSAPVFCFRCGDTKMLHLDGA